MSYTKGELADLALEEIGIASFEFDIAPEQRKAVIRRMDMMVAEWTIKGIRFPYPLTKSQTPDSTDETDIPDWAGKAIITNLALEISPSYMKTVSNETRANAKQAFNTLCSVFAPPKEMQFTSMPKGAGYKGTCSPFTPAPGSPYLKLVDEGIDLTGGLPDGT